MARVGWLKGTAKGSKGELEERKEKWKGKERGKEGKDDSFEESTFPKGS